MNHLIYTITCTKNNKKYVGYTKDFKNRKRQHLNFLRRGNHCNDYLQASYNFYGKDSFIFEILVYCDKDVAFSEENYWCNIFNSHNKKYGFNLAPTNPNKKNASQSLYTKNKRSKTMTGKKLSKSHLKNMTLARLGSKNSEESKKKVREWFENNGHPSKGVKRRKEARLKMSLASKGIPKINRRKNIKAVDIKGNTKEFKGVQILREFYKISITKFYKTMKEKEGVLKLSSGKVIKIEYEK